MTNYASAEAYLLGLVNYEKLPPPAAGNTEAWHLNAFGALLARLGHPERAFPIIHVAGTKGKGSTTRYIATLLRALGVHRVGTFTSPHIESFRERIAIDNRPISGKDFAAALDRVRAHLPASAGIATEGFRTTFEVLTAMALDHFRQSRCEAVVLETGLGGRLDATNAVTARVALLTSIGYDHQRVLGKTLRAIAAEKAGIIKPGTGIALIGPQPPRRSPIVRAPAERQARAAGVPLQTYDPHRDPIRASRAVPGGFELDIAALGCNFKHARFPLLGRHQLDNLRAALLACEAFLGPDACVHPDALRAGIAACASPGRMEIVSANPLALVDAAHCALSARAAADALAGHFPGRPAVLVAGLLSDKNHETILQNLARTEAPLLIAYTAPSPRARPAGEIARLAQKYFPRAETRANATEAVRAALAWQRRHPRALILCTGTFYGIAEARRALAQALGLHAPTPLPESATQPQ